MRRGEQIFSEGPYAFGVDWEAEVHEGVERVDRIV